MYASNSRRNMDNYIIAKILKKLKIIEGYDLMMDNKKMNGIYRRKRWNGMAVDEQLIVLLIMDWFY